MSGVEKKDNMTQRQIKGSERLPLTFPTKVTICFEGVQLCDSQSIKQYIQHTRHRRSHPLPRVPEDTNTIHD